MRVRTTPAKMPKCSTKTRTRQRKLPQNFDTRGEAFEFTGVGAYPGSFFVKPRTSGISYLRSLGYIRVHDVCTELL